MVVGLDEKRATKNARGGGLAYALLYTFFWMLRCVAMRGTMCKLEHNRRFWTWALDVEVDV